MHRCGGDQRRGRSRPRPPRPSPSVTLCRSSSRSLLRSRSSTEGMQGSPLLWPRPCPSPLRFLGGVCTTFSSGTLGAAPPDCAPRGARPRQVPRLRCPACRRLATVVAVAIVHSVADGGAGETGAAKGSGRLRRRRLPARLRRGPTLATSRRAPRRGAAARPPMSGARRVRVPSPAASSSGTSARGPVLQPREATEASPHPLERRPPRASRSPRNCWTPRCSSAYVRWHALQRRAYAHQAGARHRSTWG